MSESHYHCVHCNTPVSAGQRYCHVCGTHLSGNGGCGCGTLLLFFGAVLLLLMLSKQMGCE